MRNYAKHAQHKHKHTLKSAMIFFLNSVGFCVR